MLGETQLKRPSFKELHPIAGAGDFVGSTWNDSIHAIRARIPSIV